MSTTTQTSYLQWNRLLIVLAILVSCVTVVIKGFHLFDKEHYEPFIQGADDTFYYLWLRSWVVDGDLDFENDIHAVPFLEQHAKDTVLKEPRTATGLVLNKYPLGWAVVSLPFFAAAHLLTPLTAWPADGFSPPYQVAVWLGQMGIAACGFVLLHRILRRWFPSDLALTAILITWLNSPMVYYQSARIAMVHNVVFTLGCIVLWLALLFRESLASCPPEGPSAKTRRNLLLITAGAAFHAGLFVICRPSSLVYLILPVSLILAAMWQHLRTQAGFCAALLATALTSALLGVAPQLLAWKEVFGNWIFYSYQGEGFNWWQPQFFTSLWSPHHGWFNWHPFLLPGLLALSWASLRGRFPRSWLLSWALIIWVNASWHMVYFGSAFGGRAYEFMGVFSTIGFAYLMHWLQPWKRVQQVLFVLMLTGAVWNALFLLVFIQGHISRELPVTWGERMAAVWRLFL
jgi:hypothetical protein